MAEALYQRPAASVHWFFYWLEHSLLLFYIMKAYCLEHSVLFLNKEWYNELL